MIIDMPGSWKFTAWDEVEGSKPQGVSNRLLPCLEVIIPYLLYSNNYKLAVFYIEDY